MNTEKKSKKTRVPVPTPSISHILRSKGWTCSRLARAMNVSQPTASTWLRGICQPLRKRLPQLSQVTSTQLSRLQAAHAEAAQTRNLIRKNGNKKVHTPHNIVLENMKRNGAIEAIGIEMPITHEQFMKTATPILEKHMNILKIACQLCEIDKDSWVQCIELATELRDAAASEGDSK